MKLKWQTNSKWLASIQKRHRQTLPIGWWNADTLLACQSIGCCPLLDSEENYTPVAADSQQKKRNKSCLCSLCHFVTPITFVVSGATNNNKKPATRNQTTTKRTMPMVDAHHMVVEVDLIKRSWAAVEFIQLCLSVCLCRMEQKESKLERKETK